jgi:hypothetical protein
VGDLVAIRFKATYNGVVIGVRGKKKHRKKKSIGGKKA